MQAPVLVIAEDDLQLISDCLGREGRAMTSLPDVESALLVFDYLLPSLVIMEYPGDRGSAASFARFVRRSSAARSTPLLAIADRDQEGPAMSALPDGFNDVCFRPLSADALRAKLSRLADPLMP